MTSMKRRSYTRRQSLALAGGALLALGAAGCGAGGQASDDGSSASGSTRSSAVKVRVASLKGPTTIGLVNMMQDTSGIPAATQDVSTSNGGASATDSSSSAREADSVSGSDTSVTDSGTVSYSYTISSAADEVLPLIVKGDADIALVPSNSAAILYAKTKGGVRVIDLNTLGVLSVVTGDSSIKDFRDLSGHTVAIAGKGASPQYVLEFLLDKAGIAGSVELDWKSEHTEVAATLAKDPNKIGILPQPFITATLTQNTQLKAPISLTDVWDESVSDHSRFVMGATVARTDFVREHPEAVTDFLKRHAASVKACADDVAATAKLVVKAGIVAKEPIAEKAIPACNVVCITGDEMHDALEGYLKVLCDADPSSVGGQMPDDDFYYLA